MDATCAIQNSIHVFSLVHINMCPGFWVHITLKAFSHIGEKNEVKRFRHENTRNNLYSALDVTEREGSLKNTVV